MGIAVYGHSIARPALILHFPPLLDCTDHRSHRRGRLFSNIDIDSRFHDARFPHEIEGAGIELDSVGHGDELVEVHFETGAGLVGADLAMADNVVAVAGDGPPSADFIDQPSAGFEHRS